MTFERRQSVIVANCYALPSLASAFQDQIRVDMERRTRNEGHEKPAYGNREAKRLAITRYLSQQGEATQGQVRNAIRGSRDLLAGILGEMIAEGVVRLRIEPHPSNGSETYHYSLKGER